MIETAFRVSLEAQFLPETAKRQQRKEANVDI
jgi:hypothetical protein